MKIAWCSDIHLNFCSREQLIKFYEELKQYDIVAISGDIAEAPTFDHYLKAMYSNIQKPIVFVLGNHDYYVGNVKDVRLRAKQLLKEGTIHYLTSGPLHVTPDTMLLGVDGWADTRAGDFINSWVVLNDSVYIENLRSLKTGGGRVALGRKMRALADADTRKLASFFKKYVTPDINNLYIFTHIPPFEEVCNYRGKRSSPDFLPFYCNKKLGEMITSYAKDNPLIKINVYCGHTHGDGYAQILPNLVARCAEAEYRSPTVAGVINV